MSFLKTAKLYFKKNKSNNFAYFISIFTAIIVFVVFIALYKLFFAEQTYIYTKVKVSQGFWWAATAKPSIWYVNSIKKGEKEYDFLRNPIATIAGIRYYPADNTGNTYDIYLTIKLKVGKNTRTKNYTFNRSDIAVGSPIDLAFPSSQITGTIIDMSKNDFSDTYVEKTVKLVGYNAYDKYFPYKYDFIKIGDKYFDGTDYVFEILNKSLEANFVETQDLYGNLHEKEKQSPQNIILTAKMKMLQKDNKLIFGEEQVISNGQNFYLRTANSNFANFFIASME